jgi:3-keto-5-aminohexanoate cleavage enzyme
MSVVITVAPTGPIATKADNPHLPTQPDEIADAVAAAYQAGAAVAHIHLRDTEDRPTADLAIARRTMDLIAERCPILVQLSTGVGLNVPFEQRAALVELRPRMATLNPCSMSFGNGEFRNPPADVRQLAARMRDLGVKAELEIYDTGHLDACLRLRDEGLLEHEPLQFSIVLGVAGGMAATPDNLLTLVRRLPEGAIWQVIAIGRANITLTAMALALGGNARAGLEDALYLRKGELSPGNLPLVRRAVQLARDLDLSIAGPEQTEKLLNLPRRALQNAPGPVGGGVCEDTVEDAGERPLGADSVVSHPDFEYLLGCHSATVIEQPELAELR